MRNVLRIILGILFLTSFSFSTQSRVESMGKRPAFFLDVMSIFDNPANATFYSNALLGELGFYAQEGDRSLDGKTGINQDPYAPWFGGLFKYQLSDSSHGLRDPQITIGGFLGRENTNLLRFVPRKVVVSGDTVLVPNTITNFDGFLSGTMIDGSAVGAHVYVGIQDGRQDDGAVKSNAHVSILSMDYGANFLISNHSSIELTLGVARIQYGPSRKTFLDPGLFSFYSTGRLFLEMELWTGQLVSGYKLAAMEVPGWAEDLYDINVGMNVIIPRGFFWIGLDAVHIREVVSTWDRVSPNDYEQSLGLRDSYLIYREPGSRERLVKDESDQIGTIVSFGIERNVFSDHFIIRAGGQKSFLFQRCWNSSGKETLCKVEGGGTGKGNFWTTNAYGDGSLDDHIGFGFGVSVDNKLKIDATVAEDFSFRAFRAGRLISRISAIYSL